MRGEHPYVRWAIKVIEAKIRDGIFLEPDPKILPPELFQKSWRVYNFTHA